MLKIMELAHGFLQAFCTGCRSNQALLYDHIHLFMSEAGDLVSGAVSFITLSN